MDVLIDLLPSVNQVKTESSKKDKRQRNKYSRQMTSSKSNGAHNADQSLSDVSLKQVFWTGPERRLSVERRQLKNKRGRWLESRDKNDRRADEYAISVKI